MDLLQSKKAQWKIAILLICSSLILFFIFDYVVQDWDFVPLWRLIALLILTALIKATLLRGEKTIQLICTTLLWIPKGLLIFVNVAIFTCLLFLVTIRSRLLFQYLYENPAPIHWRLLLIMLVIIVFFVVIFFLRFLAKKLWGDHHPTTEAFSFTFKPLMAAVSIFVLVAAGELAAEAYVDAHDFGPTGYYFGSLPDYPGEIPFNLYEFYDNRDTYQLIFKDSPPFLELADTNTPLFNIQNHRRVTTNQPNEYSRTIHFFGGSTVFNFEEPDAYTLPSYFQRLVNQHFPETYRVINYGIMGISSQNQLDILKTVELAPGDVVIYYDGINDATRFSLNYFASKTDRNTPALTVKISDFLSARSHLYKYFLAPYVYRPAVLDDPDFLQKGYQATYEHFFTSILESQQWATANSAEFYHFLQPHIYTLDRHSEYETLLLLTYHRVANGWADIHLLNYATLKEANQDLAEAGVTTFDITDALNHQNRPEDAEIFIDAQHVTHLGNQLLAEHIFEIMQPYLAENAGQSSEYTP